jgi:hypothetical protein
MKKLRAIVGSVSCLILSGYGIYRLVAGNPYSSSLTVPIILAVGGFIGFIGGLIEIKKIYHSN